jgi:hypothetical protein
MTKKAENTNTPLQPSLDIAGVSGSLIEWEYVFMTGHYGYWVVKANKSKFEKEEMTANKETKWLNKGKNPNYR